MWNRRFDRIKMARHCIKLTVPDELGINHGRYKPGPKVQIIEKNGLDQLLRIIITKLAQPDWPSPTVCAQTRMVLSDYVSSTGS